MMDPLLDSTEPFVKKYGTRYYAHNLSEEHQRYFIDHLGQRIMFRPAPDIAVMLKVRSVKGNNAILEEVQPRVGL